MADSLLVEIVSPDRAAYRGEALRFQAPGVEGSFEVLRGHAPMLAATQVGTVTVTTMTGERVSFATSGGFVEVLDNHVIMLAETAEPAGEIDVERARAAEERAAERLEAAQSPEEREALQAELRPGSAQVLLFGPSCADDDGLRAAEDLIRGHPELGAIMLVDELSTDMLTKALRAGVRDVLPSPPDERQLHEAVDRVRVVDLFRVAIRYCVPVRLGKSRFQRDDVARGGRSVGDTCAYEQLLDVRRERVAGLCKVFVIGLDVVVPIRHRDAALIDVDRVSG